jgi:hypothetical protein
MSHTILILIPLQTSRGLFLFLVSHRKPVNYKKENTSQVENTKFRRTQLIWFLEIPLQ